MGRTLLAEDGLHHIVKINGEWNRGYNGWNYHFECGDDVAWMTRGKLTDEPATCLACITTATKV